MKRDLADAENFAENVKRSADFIEPSVRRLDKSLADKVKKLGDAAGEVVKHVRERKQPATG